MYTVSHTQATTNGQVSTSSYLALSYKVEFSHATMLLNVCLGSTSILPQAAGTHPSVYRLQYLTIDNSWSDSL